MSSISTKSSVLYIFDILDIERDLNTNSDFARYLTTEILLSFDLVTSPL